MSFMVWGGSTSEHTLCPPQKQARRVYEILRLRVTDRGNVEQYRGYRLMVKSRLNEPYQVCECVCVWVCQCVGVGGWVSIRDGGE